MIEPYPGGLTYTPPAIADRRIGKGGVRRVSGFIFIGQPVETDLALPLEVTPNVRFERATGAQVLAIHRHLKEFGESGWRARRTYERTGLPGGKPMWHGADFDDTDLTSAHYFLFTFSEGYHEAQRMVTAAGVASPALWSAYEQYTSEPFGGGEFGASGHEPTLSNAHYTIDFYSVPWVRVDLPYVQQLQHTASSLAQLSAESFPEIFSALGMYHDIGRIVTYSSDIRVLSLFAILELLLTHKPRLEEDDSITHQIVSKMAFITPRMPQTFMYQLFEANVKPEKVWKSLYALRSAVAHGRAPDFQKGDFQILKSAKNAHQFLDDAVRRVIRYAVSDPVLVRDLRPI